jgi:hypothetical protein
MRMHGLRLDRKRSEAAKVRTVFLREARKAKELR